MFESIHFVGIDPSGGKHAVENTPAKRLDPTDAAFVDVIHCNTNKLGTSLIMGHADFYPNGGRTQSDCPRNRVGMVLL